MNTDFPRILTLLRKERGISQKQAASALGISQALLSHYEKGIRECGLEFLVKTADFYGVSCDYLLGRSPERTGAQIAVEDIPEPDALGKENVMRGSILPTLNKKLIANALNIIFDVLQTVNDKELTSTLSAFLNLSVYRTFRVLYDAHPKNEPSMFTVPTTQAQARAMAAMVLLEAKAREISEALPAKTAEKLLLSTQTLSQNYPLFVSSLLNLIKNAETQLNREGR